MKRLLMISVVLLLFSSCYNDKADKLYPAPTVCDTTTVTYSGSVKAILLENCTLSGCHNSADAASGYILDTYNGVRIAVSSPRFFGSIKHDAGYSYMPKNANQLTTCQVNQIVRWVHEGTPDN